MTQAHFPERWAAQRRGLFYLKADLNVPDSEMQRLRQISPQEGPFAPEIVAAHCRHLLGDDTLVLEPLANQGTFHRVYRAIRGANRLIVRVSVLAEAYRDLSLHLDSWLVEQLTAVGLPAVPILCVDTSRTTYPVDLQIQQESLAPTLLEFSDDETHLRVLLRELGRFCAQVHSIRVPGFGFLDARPLLGHTSGTVGGLHENWADYLLLNLGSHLNTCQEIGALSASEAASIQRSMLKVARFSVEPRLLHGDLGSYNVLTDGQRVVGLLDWEDCLVGDPVYDIAFWATFHPPERYAPFLDGYRAVTPLPTDFVYRFWLYYLRVCLAKTVLRHRFGYPDRPGMPPAARRIQVALSHLKQAA